MSILLLIENFYPFEGFYPTCGARSGYAITFIAGDIQGKQHAVIAGSRPIPAHNNRSVMLLIKVADNRCSWQPPRGELVTRPQTSPPVPHHDRSFDVLNEVRR